MIDDLEQSTLVEATKVAHDMVDKGVPPTTKNGVFLVATAIVLGQLLSTMKDDQIEGAMGGVRHIVDQIVKQNHEREV